MELEVPVERYQRGGKNAMAIQTQGNEQLEEAVAFFTHEHSKREKSRIQIKLDTKFRKNNFLYALCMLK